jgi:uncharacterized protein (TIGR03083 family)
MIDYTSLSRSDYLALADEFYTHLFQVIESLSPAQWQARTQYIGWTAHQVLSHMASAIPVNFEQVLHRALAGDATAPPEFNTFLRNAQEVERRRDLSVQELLDELQAGIGRIVDLYRGLSDDDWASGPVWFFVGRVNFRGAFLALFGDQFLHERDLRLVRGDWTGFDPHYAEPLVDWYLRELRLASFRPEKAGDLQATAVYRLTGAAAGLWTNRIENGAIAAQQGARPNPDVIVEADTEDLLTASQGRAPVWVGALSRRVDWLGGRAGREDVAAQVTGLAALLMARATNRLRVSGNQEIADRLNGCFWHFWERTEQTALNIARDRYRG